ncbi:MAG: GNAT family N-acetyltransferase [Clostridia bacterium]|nr:GNAT family N-acetyltransferase [Clostridia bacterium]
MEKYLHIVDQSDALSSALLENNITYVVLHKILKRKCSKIFTNRESFIVCYSSAPYPVWVWCKDENNLQDVETIMQILAENFPLESGYNIILSTALLAKLKKHDARYNDCRLKMDLLSYRLDRLENTPHVCDGEIELANKVDIEILSRYYKEMTYEMEGLEFSIQRSKELIAEKIEKGNIFIWRNVKGDIVATTAKEDGEKYSKISLVYTVPQYRRMGYAINLVYKVAEGILKDGLIPILYADGGYIASNSCYKKVGFYQVGSLCNIQAKGL